MQIKISEKYVLKACVQYLSLKGYQVIRNNSGAIQVEGTTGKRFIRFGARGSSDIIACSPEGRFVAVECKSSVGKLSTLQKDFLQNVKKMGGVAIVARSIDDLISAGL